MITNQLRKLLIGAGIVGAVLLVGLAGGYVYYFSGLRTAPKALTLPSPSASASPTASSGLAGSWKVSIGSQAEYRVPEQFVGQTSSHEAVARPSGVSGSLTVSGQSGSLQASTIAVSADLSSLHSVDSVAGYSVTNRDRIVSQSLSVSQFPAAAWTGAAAAIRAGLGGRRTITENAPSTPTNPPASKAATPDPHLQQRDYP